MGAREPWCAVSFAPGGPHRFALAFALLPARIFAERAGEPSAGPAPPQSYERHERMVQWFAGSQKPPARVRFLEQSDGEPEDALDEAVAWPAPRPREMQI